MFTLILAVLPQSAHRWRMCTGTGTVYKDDGTLYLDCENNVKQLHPCSGWTSIGIVNFFVICIKYIYCKCTWFYLCYFFEGIKLKFEEKVISILQVLTNSLKTEQ